MPELGYGFSGHMRTPMASLPPENSFSNLIPPETTDTMLTIIETIGYGGKKPEDFFKELEELNPDIVVDVRENPYKAYLGVYTLPHLEKRLGSMYTWIKELGNKTRLMPPTLVDEEVGLEKLRVLAMTYQRIVLLCAEKRESDCHRGYVKKRFTQRFPDLVGL
jgi:uncharacterized protein (DUF488 family)